MDTKIFVSSLLSFSLLLSGWVGVLTPASASAFVWSGSPSWAGPNTTGNYYCDTYTVGSWVWRPICEVNGLNSLPTTINNPSPSIYYYDTFGNTTWATYRKNDLLTSFPPASGEMAYMGLYNSLTDTYLGTVPRSRYKNSNCSASQVATGLRFYQYTSSFDDEHVEASCTQVNGTLVLGRSWYDPLSAGASVSGYKFVACPAGQIATGFRMYGVPSAVDDEHASIECGTPNAPVSFGASRWVEPANQYVSLYGGYKTAVCDPGEAVTALRWYQVPSAVDDEHVDVLCTAVSGVTASVQLNFQ